MEGHLLLLLTILGIAPALHAAPDDDSRKWAVLHRSGLFRHEHITRPSGGLDFAFSLFQDTALIHECQICQHDAPALLRFISDAGLFPAMGDGTAATLGNNVCEAPFVICMRDGKQREGYVLSIVGSTEFRDVSGVPEWLRQRTDRRLPLPAALYELRAVWVLWLKEVPFAGHLDDRIGNMTSLQAIDLDLTDLSGPVPASIGSLDSLRALHLRGQPYADAPSFEGSLPPSILSLSNLELLVLSRTRLHGFLPADIGRLQKLRILSIEQSGLLAMDGVLPASVAECRNLTYLKLQDMMIEGDLPEHLANLTQLQVLNLAKNRLTGPLPRFLLGLRELRQLLFYKNRLEGELPEGLGSTTPHLLYLSLYDNRLYGRLPSSLGLMPDLRRLDVYRQAGPGMSGPIPPSLGNCTSLRTLTLHRNRFEGPLPESFSQLRLLELLKIERNDFNGTLAPLAPLNRLQHLTFGRNGFEGAMPAEMGLFTDLQELDGRDNKLTALPPSVSGWTRLKVLNLDDNQIEGIAPSFRGALSLHTLLLKGNLIEGFADNGTMPDRLEKLNLASNALRAVPEGMHTMPALEVLNMADNKIDSEGWPKWGRTPPNGCSREKVSPRTARALLTLPAGPNWPVLRWIKLSGNPLVVDIMDFLQPFRNLTNLMSIRCDGCQLSGALDCESLSYYDRTALERYASIEHTSIASHPEARDGFKALTRLYLANNSLTDLHRFDLDNLVVADFHANGLRHVHEGWLKKVDINLLANPDLSLAQYIPQRLVDQIEDCGQVKQLGSISRAALIPNPAAYVQQQGGQDPAIPDHECTIFCNTWVRVNASVSEEHLCRCLPGWHGVGRSCGLCPAMTFSNPDVGTRTCTRCPDGAESIEGAESCHCRLGYELTKDGTCVPCTSGYFGVRKRGGMAVCERCGARFFMSANATTERSECYCMANYILNKESDSCDDCATAAPGIDCRHETKMRPIASPGKYQLTVRLPWQQVPFKFINMTALPDEEQLVEMNSYEANVTALPVAVDCRFKDACHGTDMTTGLNRCREGHEGFACGICKAGYARHNEFQQCNACPSLASNVGLNIVLFVLALAAIGGLTMLAKRASALSRANITTMLIKIGMNHCTSLSGVALVGYHQAYDWPHWLASSFHQVFVYDGGIPLQAYTAWECLLRPSFGEMAGVWRHAVWIGLPLMWLFVLPLLGAGSRCIIEAILAWVRGRRKSNAAAAKSDDPCEDDADEKSTASDSPVDAPRVENNRGLSSRQSTDVTIDMGTADDGVPWTTSEVTTALPDAEAPTRGANDMARPGAESGGGGGGSGGGRRQASKCSLWRFLDTRAPFLIVTLTLIHPTVTRNMLVLLRCQSYPYVPEKYTRDDYPLHEHAKPVSSHRLLLNPNLLCWRLGSQHGTFLVMGVVGLAVWSLAPVAIGLVLLWRAHGELHRPTYRERYGFLYNGYRRFYFYWDGIFAFRRLFVLVIAHSLVGQALLQLVGWSVIAVLSLIIQYAVQPFDYRYLNVLNRMEKQSLVVWIFSLILILFVVVLGTVFSGSVKHLISIVLVSAAALINICHLCHLLLLIIHHGVTQATYKYAVQKEESGKGWISKLILAYMAPLASWQLQRENARRKALPKVFFSPGSVPEIDFEDKDDPPDSPSQAPTNDPAPPSPSTTSLFRKVGIRKAAFSDSPAAGDGWQSATPVRRKRSLVRSRSRWSRSRSRRHLGPTWQVPTIKKGTQVIEVTAQAMSEAVELLGLTQVPADFLEFLWTSAFVVHQTRFKRRGEELVVLPKPDATSKTGLHRMTTTDLSHSFRSFHHGGSFILDDGDEDQNTAADDGDDDDTDADADGWEPIGRRTERSATGDLSPRGLSSAATCDDDAFDLLEAPAADRLSASGGHEDGADTFGLASEPEGGRERDSRRPRRVGTRLPFQSIASFGRLSTSESMVWDSSSGRSLALPDFQMNLSYVIDALVTREHQHQDRLAAGGSGGSDGKGDKAGHTGGWRDMYESFRRAKRSLIEADTAPENVPLALVSWASSVESTAGDSAKLHPTATSANADVDAGHESCTVSRKTSEDSSRPADVPAEYADAQQRQLMVRSWSMPCPSTSMRAHDDGERRLERSIAEPPVDGRPPPLVPEAAYAEEEERLFRFIDDFYDSIPAFVSTPAFVSSCGDVRTHVRAMPLPPGDLS
ncbi:unnamed protein product [Vitrella brassicaformis CCMP3155]|uniref:EGF-like domain-containing protein n=5 Tax=Vitrella brassicaformis TaxID=1169539 RepID=A0A0G4H2H1_VITBC|nr:unnamed protein product [Vitrella brassicaformis CCMP3155]|eukprot:CEM37819.1 unnamed protein product [Vitrella brassicaformis CCMP3155]